MSSISQRTRAQKSDMQNLKRPYASSPTLLGARCDPGCGEQYQAAERDAISNLPVNRTPELNQNVIRSFANRNDHLARSLGRLGLRGLAVDHDLPRRIVEKAQFQPLGLQRANDKMFSLRSPRQHLALDRRSRVIGDER